MTYYLCYLVFLCLCGKKILFGVDSNFNLLKSTGEFTTHAEGYSNGGYSATHVSHGLSTIRYRQGG